MATVVSRSMASDTPMLADQLEAAIAMDEFELYYQPLIDLSDASIYGVEALIRWNHPVRGLLQPADFIHLAEETGAIVPLGSWVVRQACTDFRRMRPSNNDLILSVNVSSRQLDEPEFLFDLCATLEQTGMPPQMLQLEVTESVFLHNSTRVGALFQSIRALGVKIAFDDFGTGYSSLSYLERYPVDMLKVDQSFIQRMSGGSVSTEIVEWIVRLARIVGTEVSAEGVENHQQAVTLQGIGCNIAQGFLYSQPVPFDCMLAMLQDPPTEPNGGAYDTARPRAAACWTPSQRRYAGR